MFQVGLFQFVTSDSSVAALLGVSRSDSTKGMFLMMARPQAPLPYIVYQRIGGNPARSYQGANKFQKSRWRFKCAGSSPEQAVQLAELLKLLFATWTGTFIDGTVVQDVALESEADDVETLPHGTISSVHLDFSFKYIDQNGA